ncbi:MAG: helix-turn-helix domain-containing protein [Dysgonamonadaceae bacterium]|jgi:DNA-binding XRE family transcriptional regulator|nr:helix-turn-helix domain-containing protein [Dysgonamonadaceae bacterium]
MKTYTLEEITDKHIGEKGTVRRDAFEEELRLDILGQTIKSIRKERHLTQSELGNLIGIQKSQISKVENNLTNARFETILKVFKALDVKIKFNIEIA